MKPLDKTKELVLMMRDLEDLYGPPVTSNDNTGGSLDPAGALVPVN